ncbi:hypothetical protein ACLESO_58395, partial [Pyxidicoccus sp. 3LG]
PYGFDGIAIALIGNNHPLGATVAALFFGVLRAGGTRMQLLGVHKSFPELIQGLALLFVAGRLVWLPCCAAASARRSPPPRRPPPPPPRRCLVSDVRHGPRASTSRPPGLGARHTPPGFASLPPVLEVRHASPGAHPETPRA